MVLVTAVTLNDYESERDVSHSVNSWLFVEVRQLFIHLSLRYFFPYSLFLLQSLSLSLLALTFIDMLAYVMLSLCLYIPLPILFLLKLYFFDKLYFR